MGLGVNFLVLKWGSRILMVCAKPSYIISFEVRVIDWNKCPDFKILRNTQAKDWLCYQALGIHLPSLLTIPSA